MSAYEQGRRRQASNVKKSVKARSSKSNPRAAEQAKNKASSGRGSYERSRTAQAAGVKKSNTTSAGAAEKAKNKATAGRGSYERSRANEAKSRGSAGTATSTSTSTKKPYKPSKPSQNKPSTSYETHRQTQAHGTKKGVEGNKNPGYTVKKGDNLWNIANKGKGGTNADKVRRTKSLWNENKGKVGKNGLIKPGQSLSAKNLRNP